MIITISQELSFLTIFRTTISRRAATTAAVTPPVSHVERDIDAMLQKSQPGHFDGEGTNVGKRLEE